MTDQAIGNIIWNVFGNGGRICEQFMVQGPSGATAILHVVFRMNSNLVGIQSEQREWLEDEGTTLKWKKSFKLVADQVLVIICQTW